MPPRSPRPPGPTLAPAQLQRLGRLAAGVTATLVAWGLLVWAAIDFGRSARNGEGIAWVFLSLATIGATACLFVTLILAARVLDVLGGAPSDQSSSRPGRRAKR